MKDNRIYFTLTSENVYEGGMSRNNAFNSFFSNIGYVIINLYTKNIFLRIFYLIKFLFYLYFFKGKRIFIHVGVFAYITPPKIFSTFLRNFFLFFINKVDKNNELIIEINDLPYEQSIDLNLNVNHYNKIFQKDIFSLKSAKYVFASYLMSVFAKDNYFQNKNNLIVIRNAAPKVKKISNIQSNIRIKNITGLKVIYAGTLNKGRQISDLFKIFENLNNISLILIGTNGDWINDIELNNNILYLGNYEESQAHEIVSQCDLGLLPYDEKRLYYNICYPTKIPFYLSAGIPVLSTNLDELKLSKKEGILFRNIEDWSFFLENINIQEINNLKSLINPNDYLWETIFENSKNEIQW